MDLTGDELAGVVDLFGGLTRAELAEALAELAYRQGEEYDPSAHEPDIDEAITSYHLVAVADEMAEAVEGVETAERGQPLLLAGPLAFPTLPPDARDLPHILDIETRVVSTEQVGEEVAEMFREDARAAIEAGDQSRIDALLDASYELEPWAGVELQSVREELGDATQTN